MATELNLPSLENQAEILSALQHIVALKTAELSTAIDPDTLTMAQIQQIVQTGYANKIFKIGQQVVTTYTYNGTEYECPFYIVAFKDVELEDGETVPGMVLQMAYATCESLMFDSYEAFYYAEDGLEAGTYYVTAGFSSNKLVSGTSYQFTLTENLPAGGVLAGFRLASSSSLTSEITDLYVYAYSSTSTGYSDYTEACAISEGSDGTFLGTFYQASAYADSGLNHAQRVFFGYNRWSQSAYRQWLNSDADAGEWWEPQNDYDLPPSQLSTYAGFLQGFESDFLACLGKIKVTTALNTVEGFTDTSEDTYDTFFLPSLEQLYITPQLSGVEGDYWPYWKRALGLSSTEAQYSTNADRITYLLSNHSSAQFVWLRSAYRSTAGYVWFVASSGYVGTGTAYASRPCAPACVIV